MYVGPGKRNAALSARMAGYAAGCSHVTGCQLLQHPRVAATVKGLGEAVAREVGRVTKGGHCAAPRRCRLDQEWGHLAHTAAQILCYKKNIAKKFGFVQKDTPQHPTR